MDLADFKDNQIKELTLEERTLSKPKTALDKVKKIFNLYKNYEYKIIKVKIGKLSIRDQLDIQNKDFKLSPENSVENLKFIAYVANILIKKENPDWKYTFEETMEMFVSETLDEINEIWVSSMPIGTDGKKKLETRLNGLK